MINELIMKKIKKPITYNRTTIACFSGSYETLLYKLTKVQN